MASGGRNLIATQTASARNVPLGEMLEGVVIAGSWIASEGVVQVLVGDTIPYEAPFYADGNQPFMPICTLVCPAIGDQYAPVGGERALIWESQGSWVCWLEHGPDDTSQVPAGERWIQHPSANNPAPGKYDSALKLHNDGPTPGDSLGGAVLGGSGALTQSQTASGARHTIDDTAQKVEAVTAGGMVLGGYDQLKQILHSVVEGQLETIIDGIAQKITHQSSPTVKTIVDGLGNEIAHIVPAGTGKIGLGDLFDNLPAASGAINEDILSAFGDNVNQFALGNFASLVTLFQNAGAITSAQATTIIAGIVLSWLEKVAIPNGSPIVRLAS